MPCTIGADFQHPVVSEALLGNWEDAALDFVRPLLDPDRLACQLRPLEVALDDPNRPAEPLVRRKDRNTMQPRGLGVIG